jgi:hypothetical protein
VDDLVRRIVESAHGPSASVFLLKSLKDNTPNSLEVDQKWVDDFHSVLDTVERETNGDLAAFRVDPSDLFNPAVSATRGYARRGRIVPGVVQYSNRTVITRTRLMHKVDAVLSYFQFKQGAGEPEKHIGFIQ